MRGGILTLLDYTDRRKRRRRIRRRILLAVMLAPLLIAVGIAAADWLGFTA